MVNTYLTSERQVSPMECSGIRSGIFSECIHIDEHIVRKCQEVGAKRVLVLGTKFMMADDCMRGCLEKYGIEVMDTSDYIEEIEEIDRIIFEELRHDVVTLEAKEFLMNFVWQFPADDQDDRPDAVILGCAELNMILEQDDIDIPLICLSC